MRAVVTNQTMPCARVYSQSSNANCSIGTGPRHRRDCGVQSSKSSRASAPIYTTDRLTDCEGGPPPPNALEHNLGKVVRVQSLQIRHFPMRRMPVFAFCSRVFGTSGNGNAPSVSHGHRSSLYVVYEGLRRHGHCAMGLDLDLCRLVYRDAAPGTAWTPEGASSSSSIPLARRTGSRRSSQS